FSNAKKILLLGTARDDAESEQSLATFESMISETKIDRVRIATLNSKELRELICSFLGTSEIDNEISDTFFAKTKGNPLVAIEYVRTCLEQGFLTFRDGIWFLDQNALEKIILSNDVYQLIVGRIEGCSAQAKTLLEYAALYGTTFHHPYL